MQIHMRRILCATTVLCSCAILAAPASAGEKAAAPPPPAEKTKEALDAKGRQLKQEITEALQYFETSSKAYSAQWSASTKGEITVEKQEGYYAVTLPEIVFDDGKTNARINGIKINAVPGEGENIWKLSISLPQAFYYYDATGNGLAKVSFGSQKFNAVWDGTVNNAPFYDIEHKNIRISDIREQVGVEIASATARADVKQQADHLWSGPVDFGLDDIKTFGRLPFAFKIGAIKFASTISSYDYAQESQTVARHAASSGPEVSFGVLRQLSANAVKGGGDVRYSVENLQLTATQPGPSGEAGQPTDVRLANMAFYAKIGGIKEGKPFVHLGGNYSGLEVTPDTSGLGDVMPSSFDLALEMSDLPPLDKVVSDNKEEAQQAMMASATNITLKSFKLGGKDYTADFAGAVKNNPALPGQMAGAISGQISGLGALGQKITALTQSLPQDKQGPAMMAIGVLGMIDSLGVAKDPNAPAVKSYDIQFAEGGMTVNGQPVGQKAGQQEKTAESGQQAPQPPAGQQTPQ